MSLFSTDLCALRAGVLMDSNDAPARNHLGQPSCQPQEWQDRLEDDIRRAVADAVAWPCRHEKRLAGMFEVRDQLSKIAKQLGLEEDKERGRS